MIAISFDLDTTPLTAIKGKIPARRFWYLGKVDLTYRRALGLTLRILRKQARLSQEQLSAAIGISRGYISDLERGERDPRFSMGIRLAAVFGISLSQLATEYERNYQLLSECRGTHIKEFDVEQGILIVTLGGTAETSACLQTWRQVLSIAQEKRVNGILMDALAMDGTVGLKDHQLIHTEMAVLMAERNLDLKRAMVGRPPTVIRVATPVGAEPVKAEVFSTVEEAFRWLLLA